MASFLEDAMESLADTLSEHCSIVATYSRRDDSIDDLNVVPGRADNQRRAPGVARVKIDDEFVSFHFKPDDLDFGDGAVDPQRGDRLTIGSIVREVSPMTTEGRPCWERSDIFGYMIKVNTMRVQ